MKYSMQLLACLIVVMSSCTTAYRNMQTPDDVYFSDGRPEGILTENSEPEYSTRMKCRDRRWRDLNDDYGCHYDPYHYGYYYPYYYNPYYYPYPVFNFIPIPNSTPHYSNLGGYNNTRTIVNVKTGQSSILKGADIFNNSNGGGLIRSVINSAGSSGGGRTYSPTKGSSTLGGQSIIRPSRN
jgi:hypothetical protein